jgi:hypothetical protein
MKFLPVIVALCLFSALPAAAAKKMSRVNILVQNEEAQPVPRASIIVRMVKGKDLKKVEETFQLKTSQQGTAPLPPIRQGFVLVQVIANDYQTYGETVEINQPEQNVTITLKPPQDQLSVHK